MAAHLAGVAFIPYYNELMTVMESDQELAKTAKGIWKQVFWSAGGTIAGAAVGGSYGAFIGGIAGAVVGFKLSDDYQSLLRVMHSLSQEDKAEVTKRVQDLVGSSSIEALKNYVKSQVNRSAMINVIRGALADVLKGK